MGNDSITDPRRFAKLSHAYNLCGIALGDLRLRNPILAQAVAHMSVVTYYAVTGQEKDKYLAGALANEPANDLVDSWKQQGRPDIPWGSLSSVYEHFKQLRDKTLAHAVESWLSKPASSEDDRWVKDQYKITRVYPPPGLEHLMLQWANDKEEDSPPLDCGLTDIPQADLQAFQGLIYFTAAVYGQRSAAAAS